MRHVAILHLQMTRMTQIYIFSNFLGTDDTDDTDFFSLLLL